ncbi:Ig-like domain-containing protein, partial [Nibrella saemangeumensis]|uniref:Ig-like domain-containing protein n=1 Tax=Nibrella saemangeumensis TaxID=1084526 RepID=UPI0031EBE918
SYSFVGPLGAVITQNGSAVATVNLPGSYTVTATGPGGCSSTAIVVVAPAPAAPQNLSLTVSSGLSCTALTATLTATTSSTGVISYSFAGPLGAVITQNGSAAVATVNLPGSYTVTATGPGGCSSTAIVVVAPAPAAPQNLSLTVSAALSCTALTATLTATTSSTGVISYSFVGPLGAVITQNGSAVATVNLPGSYTVTATTAAGCSSTAVMVVPDERTPRELTLTRSGPVSCNTPFVTLTASSSTPGVTYVFSGPGVTLAGSTTAIVNEPGIYTVVATAPDGCTALTTEMVPGGGAAPENLTLVAGSLLPCTAGAVTLTANSSTPDVSYVFTGPGVTASGSNTAVVNQPGTYTVTATGLSPICVGYAFVNVVLETAPQNLSLTVSAALNCTALTATLTATTSTTGAISYSYAGPVGAIITQNGSAVATVNLPGSYTVTATGPGGCTAVATVVVINNCVPNPPIANADVAFTAEPNAVNIPVLLNDQAGNGQPASLTNVTAPIITVQPASGTAVVNANGSITFTPATSFSGSVTLVYQICDLVNTALCDTARVVVTVSPGAVSLSARAYLQGALLGVMMPDTLMRDDLRVKGYLPTTSPYAGFNPLTPTGSVGPAVFTVTGRDAIVDWVFVELRSAANVTQVVDSRAALIQRDGDIVDVNGVSPITFSLATTGNYYVVIMHRNHLGVMTQTAVPLGTTAAVVDFRRPSTPTFTYTGTTSYTQVTVDQAQVVVSQGVAMWAGNALRDNLPIAPHQFVTYQGSDNDLNVVYQEVTTAPGNLLVLPSYKLLGYYNGDINMNGETVFQGTGNDLEFVYQNVINNHPGNTLKQPFFRIREQLP